MGETLTLHSADAGACAGAKRDESLSAHCPPDKQPYGAERGTIHARPFCLSVRQNQVLQLAAHGLNHHEIGAALELAPQTVRHTLQAARRKLAARNTTHAVAIALQCNWITLEALDGE